MKSTIVLVAAMRLLKRAIAPKHETRSLRQLSVLFQRPQWQSEHPQTNPARYSAGTILTGSIHLRRITLAARAKLPVSCERKMRVLPSDHNKLQLNRGTR